jgi:hypothetical protein
MGWNSKLGWLIGFSIQAMWASPAWNSSPSGSLCSKRRSTTYRERATSSPSLLVRMFLSFFSLHDFMNSHPLPCSNLVSFPRLLILVIFVIFSLLSLVSLYVSDICYCWFSPISPIDRTQPWTFNTEQVPFRYFHLMTEAEPVSETLCRYFYKRFCLCAIVCWLCIYIGILAPLTCFGLWVAVSLIATWVFSLASSVSGCMWVCVCLGFYAILEFPRF